nr:hypothetical protein [Tanacetum cinerariifolium]
VPQDYDASSAMPCLFIHAIYVISLSLYPFTERYAQPYSFHVLYGRGVTILVSEPGYKTVGSKDLTCKDWIREEIREEFRTGSGSSNAGRNTTPVTIHTWLERFNKQKPHSFEKATAPFFPQPEQERLKREYHSIRQTNTETMVTVTWADFKKLFFLQFFPRAEQERLKREYHSIRQTITKTSTEFMKRFLRLAGFLGAAAGTEEEQAKNFQWGLRRSTLNHLMCMSYTNVAQVANAARNYEILHERDDEDTERPDKRQKSGDQHQPTTLQSSHRNHGHNNDRHGSDRRGGSDNHRSSNNNYYGNNNRDDDGAERLDKRQKNGDRHQPTTQQSSHMNHGHTNDRHGLDRRGGSDNRSSNNNYSGNNNRLTLNLFGGHPLINMILTSLYDHRSSEGLQEEHSCEYIWSG